MSRENCVSAIDKALSVDGGGQVDTTPIAKAIESSIKTKNTTDETQYKNDVRSKVSNIKQNAQLRHDLLDGHIDPASVGSMTVNDMATAQKKAENAAIRAEGAESAVMVNTLEGQTLENDLDTGIVRNTGQEGIEYDAP